LALIFFYAFAALALLGALLTVSLRNPVHCAIGLMMALLGSAGIFLLTQAEFLFAVQLIVYAGGIVLLFLFVIMLIHLDRLRGERRFSRWWPAGVACAAAAAIELTILLRSVALPPASGEMPALNTEAIGEMLLTEYLLPFEIVSILLLAALVGGAMLARGEA
jgi:NADH-quinone oxidoreductase subunit J